MKLWQIVKTLIMEQPGVFIFLGSLVMVSIVLLVAIASERARDLSTIERTAYDRGFADGVQAVIKCTTVAGTNVTLDIRAVLEEHHFSTNTSEPAKRIKHPLH